MNCNLFLNTDFRDTNDSWVQLAGNIALSPYRLFFGGKVVTHLDLENQRLNVKGLSPKIWNNSRNWICTALAIVLIAFPTLIGIFIRGFHYCISSTVEKKYRLLALSHQYLQWKEAVKEDPNKKVEDFISIKSEERDVLLRTFLGTMNKDESQKKFLVPLVKELFSKPFSEDLNYLNAKEYNVRFAPLSEEIKTFLKKSREAGTEEADLAMIADSVAEDQVQGVLKTWWLSTEVFDCPNNLYDFLSKIAGKLSQRQREELHRRAYKQFNVDIYTLSFFPYLPKEDRLDYLEKICQSDREDFYFYFDDYCLFAIRNNDDYKINITSEEVTTVLERLSKSGQKIRNRSFLITALQTNFQNSFPFFEALEFFQAWHLLNDLNLRKKIRVHCQEELKKKVQRLSPSQLEDLLTNESRLDNLEKICQGRKINFNVHVDTHCLFSSNASLCDIRLTSSEVVIILNRLRGITILERTKQVLKKLKRPGYFKNINICFLVAALQTDFERSLPFFQALGTSSSWYVFNHPNLKINIRMQEEMKKKVQRLSVSQLEDFLRFSRFPISLIYEWMTDVQLQSLLKKLSHGNIVLLEKLIHALPNDVVIIRRFLLFSKIPHFETARIFVAPYYVSRQFFMLLNIDKPLPNRLNVTERELEQMMMGFSHGTWEGINIQKELSLVIPSISSRLIPYLWKGICKSFYKYSILETSNPLLKHILSYASFKRWKEYVILGKLKDMEEQEFYRKAIPELEQCDPAEEEQMRKQFKKFCIILEELLSYKPFQIPILEHESDDQEKKILKEIFALFKTKIPSLGEICIDVIREKAIPYKESKQLPSELVEEIILNDPPDQDYRIKLASLEETTKNSLLAKMMTGGDLDAIADNIAEDQVQGVLKLWWLGTEKLNLSPQQFYNFVNRVVEKFSPANKEELHHFYKAYPCDNEIFVLALYHFVPERNRLDCLEMLCQREGIYFNVYVDNYLLCSSRASLCDISLTSFEVSEILKRLKRRQGSKKLKRLESIDFKDMNRCFLVAALKTDFQRSFPFFQRSNIFIAMPVYTCLSPRYSWWNLCQEEIKKKVQNLSPSDLKLILEKTEPKYYYLFHTWMTESQVTPLTKELKAKEKKSKLVSVASSLGWTESQVTSLTKELTAKEEKILLDLIACPSGKHA